MAKTMIVANWKMHLNTREASLLVHRLHQVIPHHRDLEVVLAPSLMSLQPISLELDRRRFRLAAQNAYYVDEGSFTGEVSFTMLRDLVHYSLIGHSERRIHFDESLEVVRDKVAAAVRNEIAPILCVGESRQERDNNETKLVLVDQVTTALNALTAAEVADCVIAYEPVWSIGTGDPATPAQIVEAIAIIRSCVSDLYGQSIAGELRVLYGASVAPEFVGGILSIDGVNGLLVGGASLNYKSFASIVEGAFNVLHKPESA